MPCGHGSADSSRTGAGLCEPRSDFWPGAVFWGAARCRSAARCSTLLIDFVAGQEFGGLGTWSRAEFGGLARLGKPGNGTEEIDRTDLSYCKEPKDPLVLN